MEGRATASTRGAAVVMLVVLMLTAGKSTVTGGSFQSCYAPCFVLCAIAPDTTLSSCAWQCLKQCITPPNSALINNTHYYCHLGCASSLCTAISTLDKPDGEAVGGCVRSCSDLCTKHHH